MLSSNSAAAIPQDIIIETLAAVLFVSIGLVLGSEKLKPISWRDWAGEIERDGGARNPYAGLEERYAFWDVRVGQFTKPELVSIPRALDSQILSCASTSYDRH